MSSGWGHGVYTVLGRSDPVDQSGKRHQSEQLIIVCLPGKAAWWLPKFSDELRKIDIACLRELGIEQVRYMVAERDAGQEVGGTQKLDEDGADIVTG